MVIVLILWTLWYAIHSWLAALVVKNSVKTTAPRVFRHYRLLYNLIAVATLVPAVFFHSRQPDVAWSFPIWVSFIGYCLMAAGSVLLVAGLMNYDLREFAGFREMNEFRATPATLTIRGLNQRMRHPLYTAALFLILGYLLISPTVNTLIFSGISVVYIFIGSELEERKLIKLYGEEYLNYRKRVRRFLPF